MQTSWNVTSKLVTEWPEGGCALDCCDVGQYATSTFPTMHLICPSPPPLPTKEKRKRKKEKYILHNLCFSFLLGIKAVPREIEISAYVKLWRANEVHYGECGSGVYSKLSHYNPGPSCILGEQCCCVFQRTPHPRVFVGRKVELGEGVFFTQSCCFVVWSSARKRKKTISSCSVWDCSYSNTWGCICCGSILSLV